MNYTYKKEYPKFVQQILNYWIDLLKDPESQYYYDENYINKSVEEALGDYLMKKYNKGKLCIIDLFYFSEYHTQSALIFYKYVFLKFKKNTMKLIKATEAARLMGVTRQAIYYLIKTEKIYFYLVGKRIYIPQFELDKLLYLLMTADGIDNYLAADFIDTHNEKGVEPWFIYRALRVQRIAKQLTNKQKKELDIELKNYLYKIKNS